MKTHTQLIRFAIVGISSNLILYLAYLALTHYGMEYRLAMSLLYLLGVLQTFAANRNWTFSHRENKKRSLPRYFLAYGACYFLNLGILYLFVEQLGFSHEITQGAAILTIAAILFLLQKYWVFRNSATEADIGEPAPTEDTPIRRRPSFAPGKNN